MKDVFAEYGAKVVWVLAGGSSATAAASWYEGQGVTFGWMTHDGDNTWQRNGLAATAMAPGVPWVGVIDADTMQVAYNNPMNYYSIAVSLAGD
jgi:hypothetical protein